MTYFPSLNRLHSKIFFYYGVIYHGVTYSQVDGREQRNGSNTV